MSPCETNLIGSDHALDSPAETKKTTAWVTRCVADRDKNLPGTDSRRGLPAGLRHRNAPPSNASGWSCPHRSDLRSPRNAGAPEASRSTLPHYADTVDID